MRFDDETSRQVEAIYLTPDVVEQRARVIAALGAQPGERIVDLGCGPGLLAKDLAELVGRDGALECVDSSPSMIALAQGRCAAWPWARFRAGDVRALPFDAAQFDAAVCTQVYEYVPDVDRALRELRRVLRPGGRVVIVDTDWGSCVWHSGDPARMRRMIECWDTHCPHPHLPRYLDRLLEEAGLESSGHDVISILNTRYDPDTYSYGMIGVLSAYAARRLGESEANAWAEDLRSRGARGEYFFSVNRYLFAAHRAQRA
jgi:SAM-dependent methyltransferase